MKAKPAPKGPRRLEPAPRAAAAAAPCSSRGFQALYALGVVLASFVIYWRSLWGPFLFDDSDLMEARSAVRLKDWYVILTGPRPLTIFSFALNQAWAGFEPFSFHLVSLTLHVIAALLLWRLARLICGSPGLAGWLTPAARSLLAVFAPLLFLATPVQTESVAYISGRAELLAATFYLAALWVFLAPWRERRPWVNAALVTVFYGCAVLGKEHALTLPAAILLADYFFLAGGEWRQLKKSWRAYTVLGAVMTVGGAIKIWPLLHVPSAGFFLKQVTWKDYLFTQFRMYFLYLRLLLAPFGLNADYDIAPSRTVLEHGSWLALAGILLLVGAALYLRRRFALASFGVLFFFVTLSPTSSFYPLLDYAAERRLYLPSIGFFLAALALVWEWHRGRPGAIRLGLAAILAAYGLGTYARNRVWQDGLALWQDVTEKSPRKWRGFNNLGFEYSRRRRFAEAAGAYQRAAELVPPHTKEQAEVLSSLGSTFSNRQMYAEAIPYYLAALKITPDRSTLLTNLAVVEIRLGQREGWRHFERAIEVDPLAWEPHFARGNVYFQMGLYDEAIKDYERVLDLVPNHPDAQYNLRLARAVKQKMGAGSRQ